MLSQQVLSLALLFTATLIVSINMMVLIVTVSCAVAGGAARRKNSTHRYGAKKQTRCS
jgi:hypothetical protein